MFRVKLVNMPFAALNHPSLALTQLQDMLRKRFGDRVSVDIVYLNHEFGKLFGGSLYTFMVNEHVVLDSGFGEWIFRHVAFPELPPNERDYMQRFGHTFTPQQLGAYEQILKPKLKMMGQLLEQLIWKYQIQNADLVGMTTMFQQTSASVALARVLKAMNPTMTTVIGGANCEAPMGLEIIKHVKCLDYVCSGPSLDSFPALVECLMDQRIEESHQINGVLTHQNWQGLVEKTQGNGTSFKMSPHLMGKELDINECIPELDYDAFLESYEKYSDKTWPTPGLFFETSRGCWWGQRSHCTFCGLNGLTMAYRAMSPENALIQFDRLFNRYGDKVNLYNSTDNIAPKEYFREVFPFLKPPRKVQIFYEVKADLTDQNFESLEKAQVFQVQPGIESLSTKTLKLMGKGTSAFTGIRFLKKSLMYQIYPSWNLLLGFPGDTAESYEQTLKNLPALTHLVPPTGAFPVRFDRYSPYFVRGKDYELDLKPFDYYGLCFPFGRQSIENFAYYFTNRNGKLPYLEDIARYLKPLEDGVKAWRKHWTPRHLTNGITFPKLYFKDIENSDILVDSRDGREREYSLSPEEKTVILGSEKPTTPKRLIHSANGHQAEKMEQALSRVKEKGWVFSEGKSFISLVLPKDINCDRLADFFSDN